MVEAEVKEEAPENGEGAGGDKAAGGDNSATEAAGGDHPSTQAAGGDNTATQTAGWEDEHMSYRGKGGGEGGELCYSVSRYENGYVHLIYETKYWFLCQTPSLYVWNRVKPAWLECTVMIR